MSSPDVAAESVEVPSQPSHRCVRVVAVNAVTVQQAAGQSGWSPRMLRYLEEQRLLVPKRTPAGYRLYDERDVERLTALRRLRDLFAFGLDDLAFALRLRREPFLARAVDQWLDPVVRDDAWLRFEQEKHERLLVA